MQYFQAYAAARKKTNRIDKIKTEDGGAGGGEGGGDY